MGDWYVLPSEPSLDQGNLGVPMDISSPITSDEEYLSPLEEAMDFVGSSYHGPEPRKIIDTRFKEPPAFQVNGHISFGQLNNAGLN